jgi:hypothetical protein
VNVTVQSYLNSLFVGVNACANAVPDLPGLTRAMVDELSLLSRMAVGVGVPHGSARARARRAAAARVRAPAPGTPRRPGTHTPI